MSEAGKLFDQGLREERQGRFDHALKYYRAAVKIDPSLRPAYNNMGVLYAKHKRPDLAIKFFTRALELGEDAVVYFNLGSESFRVGGYEDSERFLKKALSFEKRLIRAHLLLAYLYGKQGKSDKADIYFSNTLKIDPSSRPAVLGFSVSLAERGRNEEALDVVDRFLAKSIRDDALSNFRGQLLLKLGRNQESLKEFEKLTKTPRYASFTEHVKAARAEADEGYAEMFEEIDTKIRERSNRVRQRIENRKKRLAQLAQASLGGAAGAATGTAGSYADMPIIVTADEVKEEAKDMLDLSFMHLFRGEPDQALKLLFQAKKLADKDPAK